MRIDKDDIDNMASVMQIICEQKILKMYKTPLLQSIAKAVILMDEEIRKENETCKDNT